MQICPRAKGVIRMLKKRNGRHIYLALVLAAATAIMSAEQPGDAYQQARLLLAAVGPEATSIASTMAANAEMFVSP